MVRDKGKNWSGIAPICLNPSIHCGDPWLDREPLAEGETTIFLESLEQVLGT
jgi:hypothetical protein